ncbi:hypothetical protein AAG906_015676 [Vitis piasezkii]
MTSFCYLGFCACDWVLVSVEVNLVCILRWNQTYKESIKEGKGQKSSRKRKQEENIMGKVSPKERGMKTPKQKRRQRNSSNKYLRPGALAQLRYSKAATKSCTDLVKKQVAVLDSKKADSDIALGGEAIDESLPIASPEKFGFSPVIGQLKQSSLMGTPRTPRVDECESESKLESLPMDLLPIDVFINTSIMFQHSTDFNYFVKFEVKILCHLHHDQLRAVFHVSQRIRKAVLLARQFHFNYTTPDRSRQEMLRTMTPLPTEHWPFVSKGDGKGVFLASPHTPKAPRHGPRPPSRLKVTEMRQIAAVLFQESALPSRCMVPSILPKPLCKMSCVRLLLRISFSKIFLSFLVSMYIISSLSLYLQAVVRVCKFCSFLGSVRSYGTSGGYTMRLGCSHLKIGFSEVDTLVEDLVGDLIGFLCWMKVVENRYPSRQLIEGDEFRGEVGVKEQCCLVE